MTSLIALLAILDIPAAEPISFSANAAPVGKVVRSLAEMSGEKLSVAKSVESMTVFVEATDVPSEELRAKIAWAVLGRWETQSDGSLALVPDPQARATQAKTKLEARTALLNKGIQAIRQELNAKSTSPEEEHYTPSDSSKLTALAVLAIGQQRLAAIKPGERVVFSPTPNQMQRGISLQGVEPLVRSWIKSYNDGIASYDTGAIPGVAQKMMEEMGKAMGIDLLAPPQPIRAEPAKILVSAQLSSSAVRFSDQLPSVDVAVIDKDGNLLVSEERYLYVETEEESMEAAVAEGEGDEEPVKEQPVDKDLAGNIEFGVMSRTILQSSRPRMTNEFSATKPDIDPETRAVLQNPEEHEPLGFGVSDALRSYAKAKAIDLVVCLEDDSISVGIDTKLFEVKQQLESGFELSESGGIAAYRPETSVDAHDRLDRHTLAVFLQRLVDHRVPSLDELADFAANSSKSPEGTIAELPMQILGLNQESSGLSVENHWDMVRLYGMLSAPQRAMVKSGQFVQFGSMSGPALNQVRQLVFGTEATIEVGPEPKESIFGSILPWMFDERSRAGRKYNDPTELLPAGIPANGGISPRVKATFFAETFNKKGEALRNIGTIGATEIAFLRYFRSDPKIMNMAGSELPKIDLYRVGDRKEIKCVLSLAPEVRRTLSLIEDTIAKDAPLVDESGLKEANAAEVNKIFEEVSKSNFVQYLIQSMGQREGTPPPTN